MNMLKKLILCMACFHITACASPSTKPLNFHDSMELGQLYAKGGCVKKDMVKAYYYYVRAYEDRKGVAPSLAIHVPPLHTERDMLILLKALEKDMTPEEIRTISKREPAAKKAVDEFYKE